MAQPVFYPLTTSLCVPSFRSLLRILLLLFSAYIGALIAIPDVVHSAAMIAFLEVPETVKPMLVRPVEKSSTDGVSDLLSCHFCYSQMSVYRTV